MALFARRDRIALAVIATLIISGWSVRYAMHRGDGDSVKIIRGAVEVPAGVFEEDPSQPVDINSADALRLEKLPFIGPVKAQDIVDYRNEHGPFSTPDDIMKVKGIGPKTFERIRERITISGEKDN